MNDITISLAVTNLRDYNKGLLNFKWVELPTTESEIEEIYDEISNDYEGEVFISDIDQDFEYIKSSGEYMTYDDVIALNDFLNNFYEDPDMLKALIEYQCDDIIELINNNNVDIDDVIFYPGITTNEEYAKFCLDSYDINTDSIKRYIDFEELGEEIANDLGYQNVDFYEFGKEYLESVDCENILNFVNHIDLDMMGSDFAMNGYISDYGYIELP